MDAPSGFSQRVSGVFHGKMSTRLNLQRSPSRVFILLCRKFKMLRKSVTSGKRGGRMILNPVIVGGSSAEPEGAPDLYDELSARYY